VDIAQQLRGFHPWDTFTGRVPMTVCQDAADEIDTLRWHKVRSENIIGRLLESVPRWRSIDDPPPPGVPVLLFTDHLDGFVWIGRRGLLPPDVTHWMALPEKPSTFKQDA
jgi:hypothetical protein